MLSVNCYKQKLIFYIFPGIGAIKLSDSNARQDFRRQHPGIYPNPAVSVFFDTLVMGDAPATFTVIKLDGSIAPEIGRHLVRATADFYLLACSVRPQCPIAPANGTVTFRN